MPKLVAAENFAPTWLSAGFKTALAKEGKWVEGLADPTATAGTVVELIDLLNDQVDAAAGALLAAITEMRDQGMSYAAIAEATGLSEPSVAQLARLAGVGGRRARRRAPSS